MLACEGSLIDPVGGILSATVFQSVLAGVPAGEVMLAIGVDGAAVCVAGLWFCLPKPDLGDVLAPSASWRAWWVAASCPAILTVLTGLRPARRPRPGRYELRATSA